MNSRAFSLNEQDPRPPEDVEAAERESCDQGVREQEGAAGDMATSKLLPVPKPVEPIAPSIPEVEPGNKRSHRAALATTLGLPKTKPTQTKAILVKYG